MPICTEIDKYLYSHPPMNCPHCPRPSKVWVEAADWVQTAGDTSSRNTLNRHLSQSSANGGLAAPPVWELAGRYSVFGTEP